MAYADFGVSVRDVQMVELGILLEFDRVCKELDISYQLYSGTLLGAIRHKGFIPWDDDIDVCLLRDDYERFVKACQEGALDSSLFLQTCFTDPASVVQFAKIRKNGTVFESATDCNPNTHTGIWIDLFPMDYLPDDMGTLKRWLRGMRMLYALDTSTVEERVANAASVPVRALRRILHFVMRFIPKRAVDVAIQKRLVRFSNTEYVGSATNGMLLSNAEKSRQKASRFKQTILVEFEGYQFPAPVDYDAALTRMYGDYKRLPDEADRVPSHEVTSIVI